MKKVLLILAIALFPAWMFSQRLSIDESFLEKLEAAEIDFFQPADSDYKNANLLKNPFQPYDFAMQSKKEDMELRVAIIPYKENNPSTMMPQVQAMRAAASAATNNQDAVMTLLSLEGGELNKFNADWGAIHIFVPKPGFSGRKHCKMLTLYKEEKGTIILFLLFDDPANKAIEWREETFRFKGGDRKQEAGDRI